MNTSVDIKKSFDRILQTFMIKPVNKLGIEGNDLNAIKTLYKNPTWNIILNGERIKILL